MGKESSLMTDTYKYSDLQKKYENFLVPKCIVKIGGSDIASTYHMYCESINVTLSLKSASSASLTITNVYDFESSSFSSNAMNQIKLGNTITISFGYGSSTEQVFSGYIHEVGAEFNDTPCLSVTAMDVRRLMMDYKVYNYAHATNTFSGAFALVMEKYAKLCSTVVDETEVVKIKDKEIEKIVQNGSDYQFVMNPLCEKEEREFFVFNETAYYRKIDKTKSPFLTLEWANSLISFQKSTLYASKEFQIIGYNLMKEAVTETATANSSKKMVKPVSQSQVELVLDMNAMDSAKAKKRLKAKQEKILEKTQRGSGSCIGLPQIVPGRYIKLDKLDSNVNGKYYISQVRHRFGSDGFTTEFEIGGYSE